MTIAALADFVNRADVGVVQRRCRSRFAPEALEGFGNRGQLIGQELQSDETAELGVFRFVYDSHPTAAKLFENAVVGNGFADHQ